MRIQFEVFTFDDGAHELRCAGEPVEISPKAFALLGLLLGCRPRVMNHADLRDRLWPDSHVARTSLARLVTEIRHALGDEAGTPRFVRNVHGLGYAFCGEAGAEPSAIVPAEPPGAVFPCGLLWGAHEIGLREGENLIGRTPDCAVRIDSPRVSRHHARILIQAGRATVEDLESKNGTFVDGARLDGPRRLKDGENVCVGPALLIFRESYGPGSTKTG